MRDNFLKPVESSRRNEGTVEIMDMLRSMKKEMEEREKKWERQQQIREEFLEADFKRKEWGMGAEFETKRRRMEKRNVKNGERTIRKDEGQL